jgi:hypothetical protein
MDAELLVVEVLERRPHVMPRVLIPTSLPNVVIWCGRRLARWRCVDCDVAAQTPVELTVKIGVPTLPLGTFAGFLRIADLAAVEKISEDTHAANAILLARDWPPLLVFAELLLPDKVSPSPFTPVNSVPKADAAPDACVSTARMMNPTMIRATIPPKLIFLNIAHPCTDTFVPGISCFSVLALRTSQRTSRPAMNRATTLPTLGPIPAMIAKTTTPTSSIANVPIEPDDDVPAELLEPLDGAAFVVP